MLLLLILLSGFLASCAAQTTSPPLFTMEPSPPPTSPFTHLIQPASVLLPSDLNNVVAILQTAVKSNQELDETGLAPVLNQLYILIKQLQPELNFTLTVKNITRV